MEMVRFEVSNNLIPTFVFTFSRLQKPLKKGFVLIYKGWAIEKCTKTPFKMFWRPRKEQNKSGYFFLKHPISKKNCGTYL